MNFKQEIQAALESGEDQRALLDIVRRHHGLGLTVEESYKLLEQIWLDFGFSESDATSPLRHELEYLMERVWYQGSSI
jgi:hypothetical protein